MCLLHVQLLCKFEPVADNFLCVNKMFSFLEQAQQIFIRISLTHHCNHIENVYRTEILQEL